MKIMFVVGFLLFLSLQNDPYSYQRRKMVEDQIQSRGITNKEVLSAMKKVPRHMFVPSNYQEHAYDDNALPIGLEQTISQPYIVAYMTEIINPQPTDKVLEIGTGSGYQAAVLAEIVQKVYTIEIIPDLGLRAKNILDELEYNNVEVMIGDGYHGWEDHAPYDAVLVTAAPEKIPQPLIDQLNVGGKMIIPVGSVHGIQHLILLEKQKDDIKVLKKFPVRFVPFTREEE